MLKYVVFLMLVAVSHIGFANNNIPKNVHIDFSGPLGSKGVMLFKTIGDNYTITFNFNVPMYNIVYQSSGTLKDHHLITRQFTNFKNGNVVATTKFDYINQTAIYGKTGHEQSTKIIGKSYDILSLPWNISLNPDLVLNTIQITNAKKLYLIQAKNTPVYSIKQIKNISTTQGNIPIELYDLQLIKGHHTSIKFGYSTQHQNLPIDIIFTTHVRNVELVATSIMVDGKKIF